VLLSWKFLLVRGRAWVLGRAFAHHTTMPHQVMGASGGRLGWGPRVAPLALGILFAASGAVDIMGRILAARLTEIFGQRVVIENIGGATA
jgi:tripartite-type tricarboxylate transporter receptor subunit TctC